MFIEQVLNDKVQVIDAVIDDENDGILENISHCKKKEVLKDENVDKEIVNSIKDIVEEIVVGIVT